MKADKAHMPDQHLQWMDWLRFLSSLAVVLSHAQGAILIDWAQMAAEDRTLAAAIVLGACSFGQEAVLAFFVMSGMLVGGRLLERLLFGDFDVRRYIVDRTTRIYVPLIPAVALTVLVHASLGNSPNPWQVAGNLLQMQGVLCSKLDGNGVLWSLAYEFWFYVMAGAFGVICSRGAIGKAPALIVTFLSMALFVRLDPIYLFCWIGGALTYVIRTHLMRWKMFALGFVALCISLFLSSPFGFSDREGPAYRINFLLNAAGFALVAVNLSRLKPANLGSRLEGLGTRLASGSYTLFLTHAPVIYVYRAFNPKPNSRVGVDVALDTVICLGACFATAWVFYHLFERHTGKVRGFFSK